MPAAPIDQGAVASWVQDVTGAVPSRIRRMGGGFQNDNLLVDTAAGGEPGRLVVRIVRRGDAAAIARTEVAVLLRAAGAGVPVPGVLDADPDGARLDAPAMVLEHVPGLLAERVWPDLDGADRQELGRAVGGVLARIHAVDLGEAGFLTGVIVDGAPALSVTPFGGSQADAVRNFARALDDGPPRRILGAEVADAWHRLLVQGADLLRSTDTETHLVHSDANLKNLLVARRDGRWEVTGVLDWEFALSGPRLFDIGNVLRLHADAAFIRGVAAGYRSAGGHLADGWEEMAALLDAIAMLDLLGRAEGTDNPVITAVADRVRDHVAAGRVAVDVPSRRVR